MAHHGDYSRLRFCPKCGVESIEFDRYKEHKNHPHAEYICRTCGLGFRIGRSYRVEAADLLFKRHRQLRTGKMGDGVSPEAAEKWIKATEKRHKRWWDRLLRRGTTS